MSIPDGERIAKVEQHMVDLSSQLSEVGSDVKDIKNSLSVALAKELADHISFEDRLRAMTADILELRKSSALWRWLGPTLGASAGAVLTFLIINFLNKL